MVQYFDDKVRQPRLHKVENRIVCFNHQKPIRFSYQTASSLKYLYKGEVEYELNGQHIRLEAGQFLLLRGENLLKTIIRRPARGLAIFFSAAAPLNSPDQHTHLLMPLIESSLKTALDGIHTQESIQLKGKEWQSFLLSALEDYNQMMYQYRSKLGYKRNKTKEDVLTRVLLGRQFLEKNYKIPVSLDETARFAGLSKYLFIRKFTEVFTLAPISIC